MRLEKYRSRGENYRVLDRGDIVLQVKYALNVSSSPQRTESILLHYRQLTLQSISTHFVNGKPATPKDKAAVKRIKDLDDRVQSALLELPERIRKLLSVRDKPEGMFLSNSPYFFIPPIDWTIF